MREINIKILNGLFAFSFGGALLFTLIALGLNAGDPTVWWIVAAAVFYAAQLGHHVRRQRPAQQRAGAPTATRPR